MSITVEELLAREEITDVIKRLAMSRPDVAFTLMTVPGSPVFEEDTQSMLKDLMGRGVLGGLFFRVEDIDAAYEELKGKGVEFTQEPTQQPYGIDAGFRDPSGNQFRMAQLAPDAA